jgi:hypothetical protein
MSDVFGELRYRFSKNATDKRRQEADRAAPKATVDVVVGQMSNSLQRELK